MQFRIRWVGIAHSLICIKEELAFAHSVRKWLNFPYIDAYEKLWKIRREKATSSFADQPLSGEVKS